MQIGQDKTGMVTMNQSLKKLVENGIISADVAMGYSNAPDELSAQLGIKAK
jgi:twitching motility protein PilT